MLSQTASILILTLFVIVMPVLVWLIGAGVNYNSSQCWTRECEGDDECIAKVNEISTPLVPNTGTIIAMVVVFVLTLAIGLACIYPVSSCKDTNVIIVTDRSSSNLNDVWTVPSSDVPSFTEDMPQNRMWSDQFGTIVPTGNDTRNNNVFTPSLYSNRLDSDYVDIKPQLKEMISVMTPSYSDDATSLIRDTPRQNIQPREYTQYSSPEKVFYPSGKFWQVKNMAGSDNVYTPEDTNVNNSAVFTPSL